MQGMAIWPVKPAAQTGKGGRKGSLGQDGYREMWQTATEPTMGKEGLEKKKAFWLFIMFNNLYLSMKGLFYS